MIKKLAFGSVGLLLLASPIFASAQSVDVQARIASLLAQIKQLQALIQQLQGGTQTSCVDLSQNLTLGSNGSDVTSLQNYLIGKGYLDAQYNTGYYGFLTAQAVGKLQIDLGIVSSANNTAYGLMGPRTRAAVSCGGGTNATTIDTKETASPQPHITEITPEVPVGAQLLIFGDGFSGLENTVMIGNINVPNVRGETIQRCLGGKACEGGFVPIDRIMLSVPNLAPGIYSLSLTNKHGTSNSMELKIISPVSSPVSPF